jgi:uncharacterized protein (DUF1684 family)
MSAHELHELRQDKDHFYRNNPYSPLTDNQKRAFKGLSYYPHNPDLILHVTLTKSDKPQQILMQTTGTQLKPFFKYGTFDFAVGGDSTTLTVYRSPDGNFFLPFVDANAEVETYPAGRYLDLEPEGDGSFIIDFNLAYNPYCAYNEQWNCPITPAENRLKVAVRAGEKLPEGEWVTLR